MELPRTASSAARVAAVAAQLSQRQLLARPVATVAKVVAVVEVAGAG
jgi:hypothetical protein